MAKSPALLLLAVAAVIFHSNNSFASAFLHPSIIRAVPPRSAHQHQTKLPSVTPLLSPPTPLTQRIQTSSSFRHSTRSTRLHSFFGLGPAELIIIAIAGIIFIGPSKLLDFTREAGSVAGKTASEMGEEWSELKAIPEEFQKGVEEGEIEARSRKAKVMEDVGDDEKE